MKQEPEPQPGLWGPGQPEPGGPELPPPPSSPFSPRCSLPFSEAWGSSRLFIKPASLPCLALAAVSPAEQGELGGRAGGRMSSGDVSHPIPSSPTRPFSLAGRAHARTPHVAHPGAHTLDKHSHLAHAVPHDLHTQRTHMLWAWSPSPWTVQKHTRCYTHSPSLRCIHTMARISANGHTQSHMCVTCLWGDPTHAP